MHMNSSLHTQTNIEIISRKHDGALHRKWLTNWHVPIDDLSSLCRANRSEVFVNHQTYIIESSGRRWQSQVPSVCFFWPNRWYNVVALIENKGIRYYCNLASPGVWENKDFSYIDYDLDLILTTENRVFVVDQEEFEQHKQKYNYPISVQSNIESALHDLTSLARKHEYPFHNKLVLKYFELWKQANMKQGDQ